MNLQQKANLIRKWSLLSTTAANSGHATSSLSAADLMTVLFNKFYHYDLKNPLNLSNDRLIFSKGHASPLFYSLYAAAGAFPFEKMKTLRSINSNLQGHPMPDFPYTEAATGSLGQGLSIGAGLSIGIKKMMKDDEFRPEDDGPLAQSEEPKVFVLLGDSELAEGQIWEAANFASYYKLNNLIAIADINRLGQTQQTMFGWDEIEYVNRFSSFGWNVLAIDGHNFEEIEKAYTDALSVKDKPTVIIAQTVKGKGVSFFENKEGWHGKALPEEEMPKALEELGNPVDQIVFRLHGRAIQKIRNSDSPTHRILSEFHLGDMVATREVYGKMLAEIAKNNDKIIALDAEVKNSTYSQDFQKVFPDRFIECFIAEQNMVSVAAGLSRLGYIPFVSTFAVFFTRAFDQIRMARLSEANIKFVGSHAGVSIGEDGASQMGLEEFAIFGSLPDSIILQPSDAVSATKLLEEMVNLSGIVYLQTLRPKTAVIYSNDEEFPIGGSKILKQVQDDGKKDELTIVATGITVQEALKTYDQLKKENILVRVVDCYSIKPIDKKTLIDSSRATKKPILLTVEDHFAHGGLGDFVLDAVRDEKVRVEKMAVEHISHSGKENETLALAGIDAAHIVEKIKSLL